MPTHSKCVDLDLPETVRLADLYEIRFDLDAAEQWCEQAVRFAQTTDGFYIAEGLVTASVVKYARCFVTGVRLSLKLDDLVSLDAESIAAHNYFFELRTRFVAHAVNPFEETYVTATAAVRDGVPQPVTRVAAGQHRLELSASTASALHALIQKVKTIVAELIATEERQVLAFVQSLPLEAVHAFDLHRPSLMQPHRVGETRPRGVNKR